MAAYAEGFGVLKTAGIGRVQAEVDAETTPLRDRDHYQYEFNLTDISEVWRRGSVASRFDRERIRRGPEPLAICRTRL